MKPVNGGGGGGAVPGRRKSLARTLWHDLESLPSADQIERLVAREVARAERNGLHFSLALFRVRKGKRLGRNEKRLALTLLRRSRLTDEVGWFDDNHLCAVLPDTSADGAQVFADAVCDQVARKGPRPIAVVYAFPLERNGGAGSSGGSDTPARRGGDGGRGDGGPTERSPTDDRAFAGRLGVRLAGVDQAIHDGRRGPANDDAGLSEEPNRPAEPRTEPGGETLNRAGLVAVATAGGLAVLEAPAAARVASAKPAASTRTVAVAAALTNGGGASTPLPDVLPIHDLLVRPTPAWKRALDVTVAAGAIVVLSPFMLAAAAAIKLTSPGPVVFTQRRAGLGGRPFTIYKFRTMRPDAEAQKAALRRLSEQDGPAFKMAKDPRVTRIGALLRKTSLDELPQLFNVLKGDMSLVGPRPLPLDEQGAAETWQQRRLDVAPGLTCIWQIEGRSSVTFAEWVRMDVAYMRRRTVLHDLAILLKTVPAVLLRRGAR
ncbi:MAG: Undecaprenyl-phosphate galactosephosphotransferase [Phycisphaerales bacterium]|nr:Undecaprenyl-phosphate galactosephosphotransferase [Phycisphaerales bacterium]